MYLLIILALTIVGPFEGLTYRCKQLTHITVSALRVGTTALFTKTEECKPDPPEEGWDCRFVFCEGGEVAKRPSFFL
jgi:hypothetical protein